MQIEAKPLGSSFKQWILGLLGSVTTALPVLFVLLLLSLLLLLALLLGFTLMCLAALKSSRFKVCRRTPTGSRSSASNQRPELSEPREPDCA